MYNWITHTFNTCKGACPHNCVYCYCKRWGKQSELHFDESELKTDLGKGNKIFVGSSCDMWANKIPAEWIGKTILHCRKYPDNTYIYQSKNPERMIWYRDWITDNMILGMTLETNRHYYTIMGNVKMPQFRVEDFWVIRNFRNTHNIKTFLTVEPIMDFDLNEFTLQIGSCNPDFVNIGADTGNNYLPEPSKEKTLELIEELKKFTEVRIKSNLERIIG